MPCAGGPINPITGGSIRAIIDSLSMVNFAFIH